MDIAKDTQIISSVFMAAALFSVKLTAHLEVE